MSDKWLTVHIVYHNCSYLIRDLLFRVFYGSDFALVRYAFALCQKTKATRFAKQNANVFWQHDNLFYYNLDYYIFWGGGGNRKLSCLASFFLLSPLVSTFDVASSRFVKTAFHVIFFAIHHCWMWSDSNWSLDKE